MSTRYSIEEGSIRLPEGFLDRSTNIFILSTATPSPINLNIARDALLVGETLPTYVDRQITLMKKNLNGYCVIRRESATLGSGNDQLHGEQITSTHKNGRNTLHQRQAAFVRSPQRALIFSCTSVRPFDSEQEDLWQNWLMSFQPSTNN